MRDAGLVLVRELDERFGQATFIAEHLSDSRRGLNTQFRLADLLRQSVYRRLAGFEALKDAERLAADPTFRLTSSQRVWDRGAALTSTLHWFETELLTREGNLIGVMALNRETLAREDGRAADQARPLLLAAAGRGASTPTLVWPDAAADLGTAGASGVALRLQNLRPREEGRSSV